MFGEAVLAQVYDLRKFFDKEVLRDVLDTMYRSGITGKAYRVFYKLNKNTSIQVLTGCGVSDRKDVGELIAQGSCAGSLTSASNLDNRVNQIFQDSTDEISYGSIRLQPLLFQDDIFRMCLSRKSAQAANIKLSDSMKLSQLEMHEDKTGYLVIGNKEKRRIIKEDIDKYP